MKKLLLTTAIICAGSGALAGKLEFVPAPLPPIPAPVIQAWTGPYVGVQAGIGNGDISSVNGSLVDITGPIYGLHAGYLFDFGAIVVGAEVDYNLADITGNLDGPATITELYHIKARAGYDAGSVFLYGTGGYAYGTFEFGSTNSIDAVFYGAGAEYMISSNWSAGAEVLFHSFEDVTGSGAFDLDVTTIQARASYHF